LSDDPTREFPQANIFEARVLAEFAIIREEFASIRGEQAESLTERLLIERILPS
jgi:hypothetical protein